MRLVPVGLSVALSAVMCAFLPVGASGQACDLPAALAAVLPDTVPSHGPYATIRDGSVPFAELELGVGHLRPTESSWEWEWLDRIVLPLSDVPHTQPRRWIARGWTIDAETGRSTALHVSGLLETGYEDATFIVLESNDDGWFKIRIAPPGPETDPGTAWVPECALQAGPIALTIEPWQERFLSGLISPLFFRIDVPHVLRDAPRLEAASLGVIEGDYHLEPVEVSGDWMRVVVKQPSDYCTSEVSPLLRTGWVKWRSPDMGPWVWYHTRGC